MTIPDEKPFAAPRDAGRVNLDEDREVNFWASKFGCTKPELETAVKAVGNGSKSVEIHIARHR